MSRTGFVAECTFCAVSRFLPPKPNSRSSAVAGVSASGHVLSSRSPHRIVLGGFQVLTIANMDRALSGCHKALTVLLEACENCNVLNRHLCVGLHVDIPFRMCQGSSVSTVTRYRLTIENENPEKGRILSV